VESAAAAADETAEQQREAVDLIATPDVEAAHKPVITAELSRDRLKAILPRLHDKLAVGANLLRDTPSLARPVGCFPVSRELKGEASKEALAQARFLAKIPLALSPATPLQTYLGLACS
jgi:hypothetical protein